MVNLAIIEGILEEIKLLSIMEILADLTLKEFQVSAFHYLLIIIEINRAAENDPLLKSLMQIK